MPSRTATTLLPRCPRGSTVAGYFCSLAPSGLCSGCMRGLPLLLLLIMSASASSATVYKWVDDNGVTHFSDQPNPKAQKLEITGAQTYDSQSATVAAPPRTAAPGAG